MAKNKTFHKKKTLVVFLGCMFMLTVLIGRLVNLMVVQSEYYAKKADDLHERERKIKAARGRILDANGVVLADNKTVCTISVIHSQIKEPEKVIAMLTKELGIDEVEARKRVNKISSIERVKTNVEKEVGDKIREYQFPLQGLKKSTFCRSLLPPALRGYYTDDFDVTREGDALRKMRSLSSSNTRLKSYIPANHTSL